MVDLFGEEINDITQKDWVGTPNSMFKTLGASNHSNEDRQANDYYATPPLAVEMLLELENLSSHVWEPACGQGHISKVLVAHGYEVVSTDLINRGYGIGGIDFLSLIGKWDSNYSKVVPISIPFDGDICTNPPYRYAQEFVEKSLDIITEGHRVAMFLKLTFLEGKSRRALFDRGCLEKVYVSSSRLGCGKNGTEWNPSAVCYAWMIWRKGYNGDPVIKWFN